MSLMLITAAILGSIAAAAAAQTTRVDGEVLHLASKATRSELFVDLYTVGLYMPRPQSDVRTINAPSVTKAVRVAILYDGSLPDIPAEWKNELLPATSRTEWQKLKSAYQQLDTGDLWIYYTPRSGTRVICDGEVVVQTDGHELMAAFLDLWIGRTPVSSDLRSELLAQN